MPSRIDPRAVFGALARVPRRASFRALVVVPAVAVIVAMAFVVSNCVADQLRESAKESAIQNVEAIVRGYVDPDLDESSLDLNAQRDADIDAQLERLTLSGEIRRVNVWSRDGRVVYSSSPDLRGRRFSIGPLLATAYAGDGVARYIHADFGGGIGRGRPPPSPARKWHLSRTVRPDPGHGRWQSHRRV